jgi:tetratricopeptide (TPR) repeat protein
MPTSFFSRFVQMRKNISGGRSVIEKAQKHLNEGHFPDAIGLLKSVPPDSSDYSTALNLLGVAHTRTNRLVEGKKYIEQAIILNPSGVGFHCNLAEIQLGLGDLAGADLSYRKQIELTPGYGQAYLFLAKFLAENGRPAEALELCMQAVEACPELDVGHVHAAFYLLTQNKDFALTLKTLEPVLTRSPNNSSARIIAARAHLCLNNFSETERLLTSVLKDEPDNIEALVGLGSLKLSFAKGDEADAYFRLALGIDPNCIQAAQFLASLQLETGRIEQAGDLLAAFGQQYPDDIVFCRLLASHAARSGNMAEALQYLERALSIAPNDIESIEEYGLAKLAVGDVEESLSLIRRAQALDPSRQMTRYNLSFALLMSGDLTQGFKHFEARLKIAYEVDTPYRLRATFQPVHKAMRGIAEWDGTASLAGQRIVVWREQGLGDSLMMIRFLPELKKRNPSRICLLAHKELGRIAEFMNIADEVLSGPEWDQKDRSRDYDLHCSIMSLPHLMGVSLETVGRSVPYLSVSDHNVSFWKDALDAQLAIKDAPLENIKIKVGLVWAGSALLADDKARSIALEDFAPLLRVPGIEWVSLQKGPGQKQLAESAWPITDLMDRCEDFMDTAGLVMALDLVIAVDTSVVHLAGALGKPVWMLNRLGSEWRWMRNRNDSAWYPSLRIFNQQTGEAWQPVIERMARALEELHQQREVSC